MIPCDFCKAPIAPLGFAPPPQLGLQVRRPIKTCPAPGCQAQAEARVADLVARHDTLAAARQDHQGAPLPIPAQGALL